MKIVILKIILVLAFCIINTISAQITAYEIKGIITDAETGKPIPNANLFLKGTTYGAASDNDGYFIIQQIKTEFYTLVAHHIGYEIFTSETTIFEKNHVIINITLKPIILTIDAIEIVAEKDRQWQRNVEVFKEEFIGTSRNADQCVLLNPEVISFKEDSDTLYTHTDSLLKIENRSLGYSIDILLYEFQCVNNELVYYKIYPQFKKLVPENENQQIEWNKNRKNTYEGSFRHFLSLAATGQIYKSKFDWYQTPEKILTFSKRELSSTHNIKLDIESFHNQLMVSIKFPNYLIICYDNSRNIFDRSLIELRENVAVTDYLGNLYTDDAILLGGKWYKKRVCDLLPYDYKYEAD